MLETQYKNIARKLLAKPYRQTRNALTMSSFSETLQFDLSTGEFPILTGRKIFTTGILGEFAAMVRKPQSLADFEKWGCNYWKQWAKADGSISVDYGNAWHADGQIERLRKALKENPTDRRMIVSGWRPEKLDSLDLPCCHMLYQFYVTNEGNLDMIWYQRSADWMVGVPSDIILAAVWVLSLANEVGFTPGKVTMVFGDCHIYQQHEDLAEYYLQSEEQKVKPTYKFNAEPGKPFTDFEPSDLVISGYAPTTTLKFKVLA
jgi:thymidylate synthase